jgi:SPP1 gp7 family putative phage head morphogenesis protein
LSVVAWDDIWRALAVYNSQLASILGGSAGRAYMLGDLSAWKATGETPDAVQVRADAAAYAKSYYETLKEDGATIINGEKVPWLKDSTQSARDEISQIIEDGIKEGKYPGIKENVGGGYPEGTVAHDLEPYFEGQKSKASMVARTEMGRIINDGKLDRWEERGYDEFEVFDNEGPHSCIPCQNAQGQVWSLEDCRNNAKGHPNCVRTFGVRRRGSTVAVSSIAKHVDGEMLNWFSRKCGEVVT